MKKVFYLLIIISVLTAGCKTKNNVTAESNTNTAEIVVNPDAIVHMDIKVEGMSCTGCENTINSGLTALNGIIDVQSSFQKGQTSVTFDSTLTDIGKISKVISDKGYSVVSFSIQKEDSVSIK